MMFLSLLGNGILAIYLLESWSTNSWINSLYQVEVMKYKYWNNRAQSQERQHKECLNREMQYRLALDNVVNMNHGDPTYSVWVRQYAATILSRVK